jgi:uncharacterized protein (TIGR03067 family)
VPAVGGAEQDDMSKAEPKAAAPKLKNRWYQYSLRTLLAFVLVCSVALGWWRWQTFGVPDQFIGLKEDLRDNARRAYESAMNSYPVGVVSEDDVYHWSEAWMERDRALSKTSEQEIQAIRDHIERTRTLGKQTNKRPGVVKIAYWLTAAELLLAQIDTRERARCLEASYDRRKLQGVWKTKSQTVAGGGVKLREIDTITVEDRVADVASGAGESFGMLTLDPLSTPKTFEIFADNLDYPYECRGNYQLDGDVWTLTLANNTVITLEKQKR